MLDFNHREKFHDKLNALIDTALEAERQGAWKRDYLGGSRLGVECKRALQYEYTHTPKDEDRDFDGQSLRIFAAGHLFEELAIEWLRKAGFELFTEKQNGKQFGFRVAGGRIAGHVDGIINNAPESLGMTFPALWECKSMNNKNWKETEKKGLLISKPVYAAQVAVYQAYMEGTVAGISQNPALFTAVNKDTAEIYHELVPFDAALAQSMSDKGVQVIQACEAGELLPRISTTPSFFGCKFCPYQDRCWGETDGR